MAELNPRQLVALTESAEEIAKALAAEEEENNGVRDGREISIKKDDDVDRPPYVYVDPGPNDDLTGPGCWQMPDRRHAVVYPDRFTALAELGIMLEIIRNAVANLPDFGSVTVDEVPARDG